MHRPLALILAFAAGACGGNRARTFAQNGVVVSNVVAPAPAGVTMSVYFTVTNRSAAADTLSAIETPIAKVAALHMQMDHGGMEMMTPVGVLPVLKDSTVRIAPGGMHVMLEQLRRVPVAGDSVPLTLTFRRAGKIAIVARVVAYDKLEAELRR